jgi:hypothetical protein
LPLFQLKTGDEMIRNKRLNKRISDLQVEMRELRRGYQNLLDERANTAKEIRQIFTSELATYRSAVQATQTDRIKFGVLEEWINDVFKLNGLKFSEKDFIEKSEEQKLREKIAQDIEQWDVEPETSDSDRIKFQMVRDTFANVARGIK